MKRTLFLLFVVASEIIPAQKAWTLQECISYATLHNIGLRQGAVNNEINRNNYQQSLAGTLPSLNGNAAHIYNVGKSIDRFTNTFANSTVLSQNFFLSSSFVIWSGLGQYHTIESNRYNYLSGTEQVKQQENDLALAVANAYIAVIFSEELLLIADAQKQISLEQLDRTEKLVRSGSAAKSAEYDMKAQVAAEEVNVVSAGNNYSLAVLNLRQLMNYNSSDVFQIVRPDIAIADENLLLAEQDMLYQTGLRTQPLIRSGDYAIRSAESLLAANRGRVSPVISFNANIGTGTSGLAAESTGNIRGFQTIAFTERGDAVQVPVFETRRLPFNEQFRENVNKSIGFTLSVPIFNGLQTHTAVRNAKLGAYNARLNLDLQKQNLYKNIAQALTNAKTALKQYNANKMNAEASRESFRYAQEKFVAGAISTFEFNTAKNRLFAAESNLAQARYDYVFKLKVLDYYQGKPLGF